MNDKIQLSLTQIASKTWLNILQYIEIFVALKANPYIECFGEEKTEFLYS